VLWFFRSEEDRIALRGAAVIAVIVGALAVLNRRLEKVGEPARIGG
jgi:pimeloyl-ACP methyl ester carboxylesterase